MAAGKNIWGYDVNPSLALLMNDPAQLPIFFYLANAPKAVVDGYFSEGMQNYLMDQGEIKFFAELRSYPGAYPSDAFYAKVGTLDAFVRTFDSQASRALLTQLKAQRLAQSKTDKEAYIYNSNLANLAILCALLESGYDLGQGVETLGGGATLHQAIRNSYPVLNKSTGGACYSLAAQYCYVSLYDIQGFSAGGYPATAAGVYAGLKQFACHLTIGFATYLVTDGFPIGPDLQGELGQLTTSILGNSIGAITTQRMYEAEFVNQNIRQYLDKVDDTGYARDNFNHVYRNMINSSNILEDRKPYAQALKRVVSSIPNESVKQMVLQYAAAQPSPVQAPQAFQMSSPIVSQVAQEPRPAQVQQVVRDLSSSLQDASYRSKPAVDSLSFDSIAIAASNVGGADPKKAGFDPTNPLSKRPEERGSIIAYPVDWAVDKNAELQISDGFNIVPNSELDGLFRGWEITANPDNVKAVFLAFEERIPGQTDLSTVATMMPGFKQCIASLVANMMLSQGAANDILMFPFYLKYTGNDSYIVNEIMIGTKTRTAGYPGGVFRLRLSSTQTPTVIDEIIGLAFNTMEYVRINQPNLYSKIKSNVLASASNSEFYNSLFTKTRKKAAGDLGGLIYTNRHILRSDGNMRADGKIEVKEIFDFVNSGLLFSPTYNTKDINFTYDKDLVSKVSPSEVLGVAFNLYNDNKAIGDAIVAATSASNAKKKKTSLVRFTNKGLQFGFPDKWKRHAKGAKITFELDPPRSAKQIFADMLAEDIKKIKTETKMDQKLIVDMLYHSVKHAGLRKKAIAQSVEELKEQEVFMPAFYTLMDLADISSSDPIIRRGTDLVIKRIPSSLDFTRLSNELDPKAAEYFPETYAHNKTIASARKVTTLFNKQTDFGDLPKEVALDTRSSIVPKFSVTVPKIPTKPSEALSVKRSIETLAASEAIDAIEQTAKETIISVLKRSSDPRSTALGNTLSTYTDKGDFVEAVNNYVSDGGVEADKLRKFVNFIKTDYSEAFETPYSRYAGFKQASTMKDRSGGVTGRGKRQRGSLLGEKTLKSLNAAASEGSPVKRQATSLMQSPSGNLGDNQDDMVMDME